MHHFALIPCGLSLSKLLLSIRQFVRQLGEVKNVTAGGLRHRIGGERTRLIERPMLTQDTCVIMCDACFIAYAETNDAHRYPVRSVLHDGANGGGSIDASQQEHGMSHHMFEDCFPKKATSHRTKPQVTKHRHKSTSIAHAIPFTCKQSAPVGTSRNQK